jgi:hypothetical protein
MLKCYLFCADSEYLEYQRPHCCIVWPLQAKCVDSLSLANSCSKRRNGTQANRITLARGCECGVDEKLYFRKASEIAEREAEELARIHGVELVGGKLLRVRLQEVLGESWG